MYCDCMTRPDRPKEGRGRPWCLGRIPWSPGPTAWQELVGIGVGMQHGGGDTGVRRNVEVFSEPKSKLASHIIIGCHDEHELCLPRPCRESKKAPQAKSCNRVLKTSTSRSCMGGRGEKGVTVRRQGYHVSWAAGHVTVARSAVDLIDQGYAGDLIDCR